MAWPAYEAATISAAPTNPGAPTASPPTATLTASAHTGSVPVRMLARVAEVRRTAHSCTTNANTEHSNPRNVGRPLDIAHRINEFSVTAEVVRAGAAIAVLPRTTALPLAGEGLVLRPLVDLPLVRHVDALARPDTLAYAAVRRVLAALRTVAARATDAAG